MVKAIPAPSLRELLSAAKLRECTSVNVNGQKFQSLYEPVGKSLAWRNHRGTLPQSRIRLTAPSGREPGTGTGADTIQCAARKPWGCGRFSSPLRKAFSIHRTTLPQSRIRSTAPSEREPGTVAGGGYHSMCRSETGRFRAIFIAPTKLRIFYRPKTSGFHRKNDTGWARAPTV